MNQQGAQILVWLESVGAERRARAADLLLQKSVSAIKAWQHQRFEVTYADLLADPRYASAARFFLDDLYGVSDFSERDNQFARIVPALVRLFPKDIVSTVQQLAELHALSENLDSAMAQAMRAMPAEESGAAWLDEKNYALAWRQVGRRPDREHQVSLMLAVGGALERLTRTPLLRQSLRLMRGPAQAAGLSTLQAFLERGFDTFRAMNGADAFLEVIATRERSIADGLFQGA